MSDVVNPFDAVLIETGPSVYAEPFDAESFLKMPANALVNLGYPLVASFWFARLPHNEKRRWTLAFALGALLYGGIQFARIVTQARLWGILDQWATLPFFALVIAWARELVRGEDRRADGAILGASVVSYFLAVAHPKGFEAALVLHIVFAIAGAAALLKEQRDLAGPFVAALVCCLGFVFLKVFDHELAKVAFFQRLTGHFWSKVCDILQIHFVLVFFQRARAVAVPEPRLA